MRDKVDTRMLFESLQRFQESLEDQEDEHSGNKKYGDGNTGKTYKDHASEAPEDFDMNKTDGEYVVSFGGTSTRPTSLEDALDFIKKTKENGQTGEITLNEAD